MARVDASIAGGFDWLKLPDSLEIYVRNRLAQYGTVLSVHVTTAWASNRYTATVSFTPNTDYTTDQLRAMIATAFTSWNGLTASVSLTSLGEAPQAEAASPLEPLSDAVKMLVLLAGLVAVVVVIRETR